MQNEPAVPLEDLAAALGEDQDALLDLLRPDLEHHRDRLGHAVERREIEHAAFVALGGIDKLGGSVVKRVHAAPPAVTAPADRRSGAPARAASGRTYRKPAPFGQSSHLYPSTPTKSGLIAAQSKRKRADALRAVDVEQRPVLVRDARELGERRAEAGGVIRRADNDQPRAAADLAV